MQTADAVIVGSPAHPPARGIEQDALPHATLAARYQEVRRFSEELCEPLVAEDYVIQSMPDVSPTKWHLAHTSWFWETFLLKSHLPGYRELHPQYQFLFNSYYNAVGERHCRPRRGLISRPTVDETYRYRAWVDRHMLELLASLDGERLSALEPVILLGLHHEQQHQELMLTDIKHVFTENPLRPVYRERKPSKTPLLAKEGPGEVVSANRLQWITFTEGVHWIGHDGNGFAFDNEGPRHREFVGDFQLASRLVTAGEYLGFMEDGGYTRPEFWLSEGWNTVQAHGWKAPFYWEKQDGRWWLMTLAGMRPVEEDEPLCHVSYFEADAYAHWAGARLPTEAEWEVAAATVPLAGNFAEDRHFHPVPVEWERHGDRSLLDPTGRERPLWRSELTQMFGDVWEWTRSSYSPYPGYAPPQGALGEYNGKFMCNQYVLRGGSCATSRSHIRLTYRNFFPPDACWQFTGIRLAKDIS